MQKYSDEFAALQALNVEICQASGAGKGINTTPAAIAEYARLMFARRREVRAAIARARHAGVAAHRHYVDGMESALDRACAEHDRAINDAWRPALAREVAA